MKLYILINSKDLKIINEPKWFSGSYPVLYHLNDGSFLKGWISLTEFNEVTFNEVIKALINYETMDNERDTNI